MARNSNYNGYPNYNNPATWNTCNDEITNLLQNHEGTVYIAAITQSHWVPNSRRDYCANLLCKKKFTMIERKHHCRKCGEIFCGECSKYRRRLSPIANYDVNGQLYRVCVHCYQPEPQVMGTTTSLTNVYNCFQRQLRDERVLIRNGSITKSDVVDGKIIKSPSIAALMTVEIKRLVDGFRGVISSSSFITSAKLLFNGFNSTPEWQKSSNWMLPSASKLCCLCAKEFSFKRKSRHCRVCGTLICVDCSTEDLLLYVPDEATDKHDAKWSIINDFGCPQSEPATCTYLRICHECQSTLSGMLRNKAENDVRQEQLRVKETDTKDFFQETIAINDKLGSIKLKIRDFLPTYQKSIESMGIDSGSPKSSPNQNNILSLAKLQMDISDEISRFALSIQSFKNIKPQTQVQHRLIENIKKGNIKFYNDNIMIFRSMKNRLEASVPPEVLTQIQSEVNKNAITSTYVYIKQLIMEYINYCTLYHFEHEVAKIFLPCETISYDELQKCVVENKEDFSEHINTVDALLKQRLQQKRLVRPSARRTSQCGSTYVYAFFIQRSETLIMQIHRQLCAKSTSSKFVGSKKALSKLNQTMSQMAESVVENA